MLNAHLFTPPQTSARTFVTTLVGAVLLAGALFAPASVAYEYRIPVQGLRAVQPAPPPADDDKPDELVLSLAAQALPAATRGEMYSFDFRELLTMTGEPQPSTDSLSWQLQGALPAGISFNNTNGTLSGTPSALGEKSFHVSASYEDTEGQQSYTIVVNGAPFEVVQMSAGDEFTCALLVNRTVKCWGSNVDGRLGDGTVANRTVPTQVVELTGVTLLAGGNSHTCALLTDETVRCWGSNSSGQLGNGTTAPSAIPVTVNLSGVKALAAGYDTTCALLAGGAVSCWGQNNEGQLGNGTTAPSAIPVPTELTGVRAIGVGFAHACAVLNDRTVKCWGRNVNGELGNNTKIGSQTPVHVRDPWGALLQNTATLALRSTHSCALSTGGIVRCWGFNGNGRVGNGVRTDQLTATQVLQDAVAVAVGSSHTCALQTNGTVSCWGRNHVGQLGFNTGASGEWLTAGVGPSLTGITAISLGQYHSCAALTDGSAKCWGFNNSAQIGDGTQSNRPAPVSVQWE